jgi:phosphoglycerate dehydrogenase-like enzyme
MLGEKELRLLKPTAVLINAARGPLVEEAALLRALQEKWFRGAGMDVFSKEPLPEDSPLWDLENLILTPHIGGFSDRHTDRTLDFLVRNIGHYERGEPLENLVDLEEGY